jgi:serine/threonine protein kinase
MAPEYFGNLEEESYTYLVDYYAIGILFYELLTGTPPFGYYPE